MKLGLGTVQFGLNYGISNKQGVPNPDEIKKILSVLAKNGMEMIDTASLYGTSEEVLGKSLHLENNFKIITKTPNFLNKNITLEDVHLLESTLYQSLNKLNQSSIYGLLLHNADNLFNSNSHLLFEKMLELKEKKLVSKIGVSIYTAEQIDKALDIFKIDMIQLPINVLDQRLLKNNYLKKLKELDIEIHARSVFLQGLLLMNQEELDSFFDPVKQNLKNYHEYINKQRISPVQSALKFLIDIEEIDKIIIGVCNENQLIEIIESLTSLSQVNLDFSQFSYDNDEILNPSKWKLKK
ncbi:MAG: hypothetical protein A2287_00100 [Candidatus Melainabacteria bacterium RIFOXYA12_FULL_32_12]|nr:MAG: hypothetical protein A2255_10850 [Candidatus Melainabacteria bacterium RIFOXYA2_FULL_32_9]OGI31814.1 MAG: hypothetical protein A2287_00100 [Candidatus Melainabacteria bacterium RIFOXYA12_FULL_32_12]